MRLKELRLEKKCTQSELAEFLNINQGTYSCWESGKTQSSIEQLIQLANFFEVSIDYIVGRSDDSGIVEIHSQCSPEQAKIWQNYNRLSPEIKHHVCAIVEKLCD